MTALLNGTRDFRNCLLAGICIGSFGTGSVGPCHPGCRVRKWADSRGWGRVHGRAWMAVRVVEVVLPNQSVALVQVEDLDEGGQVAEKVGWKDTFDLADVSGTLEGIAGAIRSGLEKVMPSKTT